MDPAVISVLSTIVTAVGFAFRYMWVQMMKRHVECETDRQALWKKVTEQDQDLAVFKGCQNDDCGARESFRRKASFGEAFQTTKTPKQ